VIAAGATLGVLALQREAGDRSRDARLLRDLQGEVSREDTLSHDVLYGFVREEGAIAASRRRAGGLVDQLRGSYDDLPRLDAALRDYRRATERQMELARGSDLDRAAAYHEVAVEPVYLRLDRLLRDSVRAQRKAADERQSAANLQSALMMCLALLFAALLLWRFAAARTALGRAAREAELADVVRESERRFRRFADHAADGFFLIGRDGRFIDVNRAACESLGYTREELLAMYVWDVETQLNPENLGPVWEKTAQAGYLAEGVHRRKDGSTFTVEARTAIVDADGESALLALVRDTTRRRETERQLRLQAQLLDQVDAAVVATDLNGVITQWNRGATELLGWPARDVIGRSADELGLWGPRAEKALPHVRERLKAGESWDQELRLARRDGSRFHAYLTASPVRDETGEVLGLVGVAVDVSERKRAADELARRVTQQAAVAELGRHAMKGTGIEELLRRAIETLEDTLEVEYAGVVELGQLREPIDPDSLAGYTLARGEPVVTPDFADEIRFQPPAEVAKRGTRSGMSVAIEGRDGPFGLIEVHTTKLRDFNRDDVNFVRAVANVLSAAVTREREEQLEHQLQRARRLESIGQLAGGVAHDFNNLLAVILNFAEFALDESDEGTGLHDDLREIQRAAERAAELTRQLLVFSRRDRVDTHTLDLNDAVSGTEGMLRRTIGEHIELRSELDPQLWPTRAGGGHLEQVLINLALNARDAMPDGGQLVIRTENVESAPGDLPAGRWVRLTVEDTGLGMPEDVATKAFDPFFTTKPKGQGTGLGLATVYGIVSQARGEVTIESRLGRGTTISIWLPAAEGAPSNGAAPTAPGSPRGLGETILVVEDEDQVRALTSRILAENGYSVLQASNGEEAVGTYASGDEQIDLLVTDVVMPAMSGADLAERLLAERPDMKVLYMSGYTGDVILRHGPRDRDAAVLEKPFSAARLLRSVRESLETSVSL
jgi:two-component system, cell cycle sensor histidine kinase and response regulator CckA